MALPYHLWTQARSWCDYSLSAEDAFLPGIRSLFPPLWPDGGQELRPDVELICEPDGPRGPWAVSVRSAGQALGYLGADIAPAWAGVIRRIIASGFIPTTASRIYGYEYDGFDGIEFRPSVTIALGEPKDALPLNNPPGVPYTMLPRSSIVQVTKEDQYSDGLLKFVPAGGRGSLFATLHESTVDGRGKIYVEVRIDDETIGQLTPQMSQRFLPMIRHLSDRGLLTACWADITGSAVAAEVRIDGIKANEASPTVLDGPPITIPPLLPALTDASQYNLTAMRTQLAPLHPVPRVVARPPAQPPDGSVVRFSKANGRYNYVAVRCGDHWETTATADWGSINELMSWADLAPRVTRFEIAKAWAPVDPHNDPRLRDHLAVIRFTIDRHYLAAINVSDRRDSDGDWYTTIGGEAKQHLPLGDNSDWPGISRYGQYIQVVTEWVDLL